jgi:NTP pyrophosphatase (non-canonical NTP hydrolase)
MSLEVERVKAEQSIHIDFLEYLMLYQVFFESERKGTDGSLYEHNTLEHGITRGIIGEAQEALEELKELKMAEILTPDQTELLDKLKEKLQIELCDVLIFMASVFIHAGMSPGKVMEVASKKMRTNNEKYRVEHFENRRVAEAMQYSRDKWDRRTPEQRYEERRLNGHPMPRTGDLFGATPEPEYSTAGAGAIT